MRIIYLIIGFLSLAWLLLGLFYLCCRQRLSFCCLLLVSPEVPSASKIGFTIPSSIKHM